MSGRLTPQERLAQADKRIDWLLAQPGTSEWLKACLRSARAHEPVQLLNDLELLGLLLRERAGALVDGLLAPAPPARESPCSTV
ncbi:hypothetical protein J7I44_07580 [Frateuria sp. MAH-13]|uniref:Uncharacterized protein n=1 Tax=Frateuria flava TaxID=2821489 RepID=A0ABS4DM68_9GAMM|nr:hypothetical protein [Frateuria flava]MBP1474155.1 hypothetical protein [Frateuria flava]